MQPSEPTPTPLGPWTREKRQWTVLFCWGLLVGSSTLLWRVARQAATASNVDVAEAAWYMVCFLTMAYAGFHGLLATLRGGTWLHGSVLTVRGAFLTRSVDLAAATVRGEIDDPADAGRISLVAHDAATGHRVSLNLGSANRIEFTTQELDALADAIDTARSGPPADEEILRVAARLRLFYRRPYPVGRYLWEDPPIPPLRRLAEVDEIDFTDDADRP
ncbi:hypothetical protein AB0B66_30955 [Catellatospora sp. NPDC049111]|uniref:hypothetical protein n=1 Tax=Catellatospora sp. NPDC049111 TaxID=3155271 RepID=UPI0033DCAE8B